MSAAMRSRGVLLQALLVAGFLVLLAPAGHT